jgi:lysophospholipase L1-like esterase
MHAVARSLVIALPALLFSVPAQAAARSKFNPPKAFYLALGDSVTYGYQSSKVGLPPEGFDTGYVDVFAARLRDIQPGITIVNYGCPGETTASFLSGPCLWTTLGESLHDPFTGSQLEAALAFLRSHPGQVNPITLTLWGGDVRELVEACQGDLGCVQDAAPRLIRQIASNHAAILGRLRDAAPGAEIIVTGAWDSFLDLFAFADPLFQALNATTATVAASYGARFADPFPTFNPQGDPDEETRAICTLTLLCTDGDSHPSDAGYRALADVVYAASGYSRLDEEAGAGPLRLPAAGVGRAR